MMLPIPEPGAGGSSWHGVATDAVARMAGTSPTTGLSEDEVLRRRAAGGANVLPEASRRSILGVFLGQFASPLIYLLFVAAGIAVAAGKAGDGLVILVVVLANALVGTFQEGRAERSMEALRRMAELRSRVWREGREQLIAARDLVPGDVLILAAGDAVGADARVIEVAALEIGEAALTGESLPVAKDPGAVPPDTPLGERRNMVYAGTAVAAGRARAVVVATGLDTEVGRIAAMTESAEEPPTPLERRLAQFGRWVAVVAVGLFGVVVAIGVSRQMPFTEVLMVAIGQMVSLVPEGLPVAMTVALAVGLQRMAARGAMVRRLAAVETLGATTVICTDKTGTLTRNEMTVTRLWLPVAPEGAGLAGVGRWLTLSGAGYAPVGDLIEGVVAWDPVKQGEASEPDPVQLLLEAGALCNDAQLVPPDATEPRWRALGDPTEAALLTAAFKAGLDPGILRREWPRVAEEPFDSATRRMVTWHASGSVSRAGKAEPTRRRGYVKGAAESVLDLCTHYRDGSRGGAAHGPGEDGARAGLAADGRVLALGPAERAGIDAAARSMAVAALRVLAVAMWPEAGSVAGSGARPGAVFLGLIGEMDPPREEVKEAVAACRRAGVRVIMVTGDHPATGLAVASELGIAGPTDLVVDGRQLEALPEQDLRHDLPAIQVFARVHPAQKLRIVEALQASGEVVAMTGDGVNDAPALARADVGIAMGLTGTEVAKSAAKVVITDDNFATIVAAVGLGRLVYQNLQKVLLFLVATSLDEVIVLLLALCLGYPLPLAAVQILWVNLVTEGTLTVNLVMERAEGTELTRRPIGRGGGLFNAGMLGRMSVMVATSVAATFGFFVWRLDSGAPFALVQSETFTVLAVCQWFNVLNCRSETQSALHPGILRNLWLTGGLVVANLLQLAVIYAPPLNAVFHTVPIPAADFLLIGVVASSVIWVEEFRKWRVRRGARLAGRMARTGNSP